MYVIMNKAGDAVFNGYTPLGNVRWVSVDELKKETKGFQICMYKDPTDEMCNLGIKGHYSNKVTLNFFLVLMEGT